MPAIQRSEFALALNQVANERGIDPKIVLETVENAILAAYRKDHPEAEAEVEEYSATLDPNTGEARVFHEKQDVTPPGFGRIAAQTAKQVILQKIREKEKEAIITDYKVRIGTIANGMVLRFAGPNIIVDVGKAEGIMPPQEQISNEKYHLNQKLAVYLKEIHVGPRGEEVVVSRSDNGLLEGLLKREVPEVAQGSVEVKAIVREPGNRAKIAVYSSQSGIDPVGSCVGQKGVRVQSIIAEFGGIEKIDIIQWQADPKEYVIQALSPAKNLTVDILEKEKLARIKVPQEELSLAIGKDGQNVRLASKLTGYRIEIEGDESMKSELSLGAKKSETEGDESDSSQTLPSGDAHSSAASADSSGPASQSSSEASEPKEDSENPALPARFAESRRASRSASQTVGVSENVSDSAVATEVSDSSSSSLESAEASAEAAEKAKLEKPAAAGDNKEEKEMKLAEVTNEVVEANTDKDAPPEVSGEQSTVKEEVSAISPMEPENPAITENTASTSNVADANAANAEESTETLIENPANTQAQKTGTKK